MENEPSKQSPEQRESAEQSDLHNSLATESCVTRRRALLTGLAAAPAIFTLISRPVWAQTFTVSPGLCASLAAGTSLHGLDQQTLKDQCNAATTTTTETTTTTTIPLP
jgi:hypothetical protein